MRSQIGSRWYFGWNIVAAAALLTLLSTGLRLGIGPYFLPIAQDLGFSRTLLAAITAGSMLCYGLAMPLVGLLVGRVGTRKVLLLGATIVPVAALWAASAREPFAFLLTFGLGLSFGLACLSPVALTPVISHWFTRRRGMALFFLATGSMAGMALLTPAMALAIDAFGWRATLVGTALLLAACSVASALLVIRDVAPLNTDLLPREAEAQRVHAATLPQPLEPVDAIRTAPFWRIVIGMFCCGFSMNLLSVHGVPMLVDRGFSGWAGASAVGLVGLVAIAGTVILAAFADRVPRRNLLAGIYLVRALGFFGLVLAGTASELYAVALLLGLVWAASPALSSSILVDVYGVRLVGLLYGLAFLLHQVGAAAGSLLGGWAYDVFGTHWIAFGGCGALLLAAAALTLQLPRISVPAMAPRPAPAA